MAVAFCEAAERFLVKLGSVLPANNLRASEETQAVLWRQLSVFLSDAAKVAPMEIRSEAVTTATVVAEYADALERVRFVATRVPGETAAKLQSPEFLNATARLAEFSRRSCGLVD
jgi:hypothetical protein